MNAPVTRRALLGATAAVGACALPAVAEAGFPVSDVAHPDAALLDLIARHAEADRAVRDAEERADRLVLLAAADHPPQPKVLVWRPGDFPRTSYGRGAADEEEYDGRRRYRERGVEWLRRLKPPAVWTEACEARRREVVAAWDGWRAACDAVDGRVGLPAAEAAVERADEALASLTRAILATAPATLAGLAAKARWTAPEGVPDSAAVAWRLRQVAADAAAMAERGGASS